MNLRTASLTTAHEITDIHEAIDAVEAVIKTADPAKRQHLADTIDAYAEDFPDEFFWSVGVQAPSMLANLIMAIDVACHAEKPPTRHRPKLN